MLLPLAVGPVFGAVLPLTLLAAVEFKLFGALRLLFAEPIDDVDFVTLFLCKYCGGE